MVENIAQTIQNLKKVFRTGVSKPVAWRKHQLRQLRKGILEMEIQMAAANKEDLDNTPFQTKFFSTNPCIWDIDFTIEHLDEFAKDVTVDTPLAFAPAKSKVRYEPLGVAVIYGSWNYPFLVTLKPLVQAIAAGNLAILKPSEMAERSSAVIKAIVEKYLDKDCFAVIEGGPEVCIELQKHHVDLICFTGSTQKGRMVAEAAGKHLTPCILELGGKCPAVIDIGCNLDLAISKICMARYMNSGQTCISTDYVLVHESMKDQFLNDLQLKLKEQYGEHPNGSQDQGKIICDWHCDRIKKLIDTSGGKIICGGRVDRDVKYIEPTVIVNPEIDSPLMQEEIFGPVLPVLTWNKIEDVIEFINNKDKPLAVYYFGPYMRNTANRERLMNETSSGAFVQNDVMIHMLNHGFGFGGVGPSGYGRYGGYDGFKMWSNPKSVMCKPGLNFYPLNQLAPPFTQQKQDLIKKLLKIKGQQSTLIFWTILVFVLITFGILIGVFYREIFSGIQLGCRSIIE
eukprot:403351976